MLPLFERLFRRHPPGYPHRIDVRFDTTLVYEGSMRTGADLLGKDGGHALAPLIYHQFIFEHDNRPFSFIVRDDARAMDFTPGERHPAHLDPVGQRVLFRGQEGRAFPVVDPDDDDDA